MAQLTLIYDRVLRSGGDGDAHCCAFTNVGFECDVTAVIRSNDSADRKAHSNTRKFLGRVEPVKDFEDCAELRFGDPDTQVCYCDIPAHGGRRNLH